MINFYYIRLSLLGVHLALMLVQLSAGASERHIPWTLDGAQEQIEKYRMAL